MSGNQAVQTAAQMALEGLEVRQLMSASLEGGVLEVTGTGRRDDVTLRAQANRYVLTVNGERSIYARDAVGSIRIEGNKGHDNITILSKVWNASEVKIDGGLGRDVIARELDDGFPSPPLLTNAVYARDFGAVGDGVTDDAPAIQAALDTSAPGSTIVLDAGKTYYIGKGLVFQRPIALEGRGATLLLNPRMGGENIHVRVMSKRGAEEYEWLGPITAGETEFMVAAPGLSAGDTVEVNFGQDPHDEFGQHYTGLAKVVYSDGLMVRLDTPVPHDIVQGNFAHRIRKIDSVAENVTVRNLRFDWVGGRVIDSAVWIEAARNVTVEHMRGRFTAAVVVADSTGVVVRDVKGELIKLHPTGGRVLTAWQSEVELYDVQVSTNVSDPVLFAESWNRRLHVEDIEVDWQYRGDPRVGIIHLTGNSKDNFIGNVRIHNASPVILVSSGGQPSEYEFGRVEIDGQVWSIPLSVMESLKVNGVDYGTGKTLTKQLLMESNWTDKMLPLVNGIIKKVTVELANAQGVQGVFVINPKHQGVNGVPLLVEGRAELQNIQNFGITHPENSVGMAAWRLNMYTAGNVLAGTMLTVHVEYYPV